MHCLFLPSPSLNSLPAIKQPTNHPKKKKKKSQENTHEVVFMVLKKNKGYWIDYIHQNSHTKNFQWKIKFIKELFTDVSKKTFPEKFVKLPRIIYDGVRSFSM